MNFRFTVVETNLNRAEFRWKWILFLERSLLLGLILCGLVLFMGGAILVGVLTSRALVVTLLALLAAVAFIAWAVILIGTAVASSRRPWLAAALERVDPRLLDRLNTLVSLEQHRPDGPVESFARRIARQTQSVLARRTATPFPAVRPLKYALALLVLLTVTVVFYGLYPPWSLLQGAQKSTVARAVPPEQPLDLGLPATNNVEQDRPWGEVRITEPGADLRVTKVDVVPLQIEAAANQALTNVSWFSTINGGEEVPHNLPPPSEPRYAVYQPTLYLDELNLSDWDVLTYYARARTDKQDSYASEVYFLEVRPFREDILKLPGGQNGMAYQSLEELSALISEQEHVIRQTHRHIQRPPDQEKLRAQDRRKLSEAEGDLSDSTQHLYAKMATQMENKPIGEALDNLAKAQQSLDSASKLLLTNSLKPATHQEGSALSELVAARKMFQKAVSDNPSDFADQSKDESSPTAEGAKTLDQMAEFRDEAKAAREFVERTLEQQRQLEQQARSATRRDSAHLSERESQLQHSLQFFEDQHPQPFNGARSQSEQAQQALADAAQALQQPGNSATQNVQQATQSLEKLGQAMNHQLTTQQLADAYRLKQMLDRQAQLFDQRSRTNSRMSDADLQQNIDAARQTLEQLKRAAEQDPTRDAFGPPLREALNDQNKADLDSRLQQLQDAQDEPGKEQSAAQARDGLARVGQAFTQSQPKSLQLAQQKDALQPGGQDRFDEGMTELDSLIRQLESRRPVPREDLAKEGREALQDLQSGLPSLQADNQQAGQLLDQLGQQLQAQGKVDPAVLRKLMEQLQHFSMEAADQLATREDKPDLTHIDPARLPPAYRGRIQKYFEKLSER